MTEQTRPTGYSTGASCERTWESRRVRDTGAMQPAPAPVRALVVDDEPHIREVICFALERAGMTTTAARSGTEALTALRRHRADLMVLDAHHPRLEAHRPATLLGQVKGVAAAGG